MREIGKATITAIVNAAQAGQVSCIEISRQICKGFSFPGLPKQLNVQGLKSFIQLIDSFEKIKKKEPVTSIMKQILEKIKYQDYIRLKYPTDWEGRWENLQGLINYLFLIYLFSKIF